MKRVFSFNQSEAQFIVETIPFLLPGIEKVIGVFCSSEKGSLEGIILRNTEAGISTESLPVTDNTDRINKMRSDTSFFSWIGKEDIPFEIIVKDKLQLSIFNELDNNVLVLKIGNSFDSLNDLFFIYFNRKIEKLGIININKPLSTEHKTIIAQLIRGSLLTMLEIIKNDRDIHYDLSEYTRLIQDEVLGLKSELQKVKDKAKESIIRLSNSYLNELSYNDHCTYSLTGSAVLKLKEFDGDPASLKTILEKAGDYARNLNPAFHPLEITIHDYHIVLREFKEKHPAATIPEQIANIPEKYRKTMQLLDRLEGAASSLKSRNQLLTSQNLGNALETPVTPPAITDAVRKHGQKIIHLFNEYPDRWKIIRHEFRPIQNMISAIHELKRQSA